MQEPQALPLASIRRRKLLSQRALARQAGVALSTIYLLEAGKTEHATFKVMRAVSNALDAAPESIAQLPRPRLAPAPLPTQTPRAVEPMFYCGVHRLRAALLSGSGAEGRD